MTIRVKKDRIEFVSDEGTTYTLRETVDGFSFDGVIEGTNIIPSLNLGNGFVAGGTGFSPLGYDVGGISRFPFSSQFSSTEVGVLSLSRGRATGSSSTINGYTCGAGSGPVPSRNHIDKFPFTITEGAAKDVGDLTQGRYGAAGHESSVSGYVSGGALPPDSNTIDKFPFAADANATDVGDLTVAGGGRFSTGTSSPASGYSAGGDNGYNTIQKFPFSSDSNSTDVGDLTYSARFSGGHQSVTHGYITGAHQAPASNTINKFPYASDTNATDIGDLTRAKGEAAAVSSGTDGYLAGGHVNDVPGPPEVNKRNIDKFPFVTDTNATEVGELSYGRSGVTGTQG